MTGLPICTYKNRSEGGREGGRERLLLVRYLIWHGLPHPSPPSRLWNRAKWNGGGRKELIGAGGGGGGKNDEIEENIHKKGKKQMKDIFMFFKEGK